MAQFTHFIENKWIAGEGPEMQSENPATNEILWEGREASKAQVDKACEAAKAAFKSWSTLSLEQRLEKLQRFQTIVDNNRASLTERLSQENGKPLWEAETEIQSVINKLPIALEAYRERCPEKIQSNALGSTWVKHRPQGPMAVFSPFNFPAHLPLGHIIPALLAGNTLVLKGSPLTPWMSETLIHYWEQAGLEPGVINLIQGGGEVGSHLVQNPHLKGILFTGSYATGQHIQLSIAQTTDKILALEMGGNNPLVLHDLKTDQDLQAAVYYSIQSAYLTSGQRCTCARRLILTRSARAEEFLAKLIQAVGAIQVGPYTQRPEPFMGPVISREAKAHILKSYQDLVEAGARVLVEMKDIKGPGAFLSPGLLEVNDLKKPSDQEIFGPLLQVIWVPDFETAIQEANRTHYGLSSSLLTGDSRHFQTFVDQVQAGIINCNRPSTGTNSQLPFGGLGKSGNYRPSGYYAADYCAHPVVGTLEEHLKLPEKMPPGLKV